MTVTEDQAIGITDEQLLGLYEQMEVIRRTEKAAHDMFLAWPGQGHHPPGGRA